ncbi:MAG: nickel-dependent lactate racemase [Bacillota bacterium]|nr:nickel-dependent lactate racemase [Bacillota bacterium]MDW7677047.1 nickel-dependent lactate racemase [Bacillota bacterium]
MVQLKYGKEKRVLEIPDQNLIGILEANPLDMKDQETDELGEIRRALHHPIGTPRLAELVKPGQKIVIMASDITRPAPSDKMLPLVLEELERAGVRDEDVKVIFGMGIHRRHTEDEKRRLAGDDVFERITCIDSNEESYISLGTTRRGTPIHLCQSIVEADVRICTGNIEYHYFAGYSGGAKAIMPGAANYESIRHNHKLQLDDRAASGVLEGNPVREDIDEIGEVLGITFILNVVLNEKKQVAKGFAGHYLEAHRAGCHYLDSLYSVAISEPADIVVVSAGGSPKDINMYQAQKALDNASHAVKEGGVIILLGECQEGFGEETFEEWIREAEKPDDLINRLKREFVLGGHKAAAIAKVVNKATVVFVTAMPYEDVSRLYFLPCGTAQQALEQAFRQQGADARVLVIPMGGSILPYVSDGMQS